MLYRELPSRPKLALIPPSRVKLPGPFRGRSLLLLRLLWVLMASPLLFAQSSKRIAIVPGNGLLERSNPAFALGEERVAQALNEKMSGQPGFEVVGIKDQQDVIEIQNRSNSDRYSAETAARIGKLTSAEYLVLVNLVNGSQTSHQENSPRSAKTIAVVQAEVTARLVDLNSGVNLATPRSTFEQSAVALETKTFPILKTSGPGLPSAFNDLWTKATESLASDLAAKLKEGLTQTATASVAAPGTRAEQVKVLGTDKGSVFVDAGSLAGINAHDRFQIVRVVPTSLTNADGSPVTKRQMICVLTVDDVNEKNASGMCPAGNVQKGDVAEPMAQ